LLAFAFASEITQSELQVHVTPYDMKRLDLYTKNMTDYHVIMDLVPMIARLYFLSKMGDLKVSAVQSVKKSWGFIL
jgi:N-acetyltransferase 10